MPSSTKPCKVGTCSNLTANAHCDKHKERAGSDRPSTTARGYDARWRKLREAYLAEHPICEHCEAAGRVTLATLADHKVPISAGGEPLDWRNLQSLCIPCHAIKTQADLKKYGPVIWTN